MNRMLIARAALVAGLLTPQCVVAVPVLIAAQTPAQVSPADAAPFIGAWTLALQGPNGPATFTVVIKVDKDKVVAETSSEQMPVQPITNVTKADKSLVLRYNFDYQGQSVDAAITLTPGADGKVSAQADFAGGAYTMTGTATKKEKDKDK